MQDLLNTELIMQTDSYEQLEMINVVNKELKQEIDRETIKTMIQTLGLAVFEIRLVNPNYKKAVFSGYFDNVDIALNCLEETLTEIPMPYNCYIGRSEIFIEKVKPYINKPFSIKTPKGNKEMISNKPSFLIIDIDPIRMNGTEPLENSGKIPSTDEELQKTEQLAEKLIGQLDKPLIYGKSGNGVQLIYRVNADTYKQVREYVNYISEKNKDPFNEIDSKVNGDYQIIKLLGTKSLKGEESFGRSHRMATIKEIDLTSKALDIPEHVHAIGYEKPVIDSDNQEKNIQFVKATLKQNEYEFEEAIKDDCTMFKLNNCIFNHEHKGNESSIMVNKNGLITYQCFHDSCDDKTWPLVKEKLVMPEEGSYPLFNWKDSLPSITKPERGVPALDYSDMPPVLSDYVKDSAHRINCNPELVLVPLIISLSSVVANKFKIQPKKNDTSWNIPPILWGINIADSGSKKSPASNEALAPLRKVYREEMQKYEVKKEDYDKKIAIYQKRIKINDNKINATLTNDKLTRDEVDLKVSALQAELGDPPEEPIHPMMIMNDATVEAVQFTQSKDSKCRLYYRDELSGFFNSLEKTGHETARKYYLESFDGGSYSVSRKTSGDLFIESNKLCFFGAIQMGAFEEMVEQAVNPSGGNDGFLQRFQLMVKPDQLKDIKYVDESPNHKAMDKMAEIFRFILGLPDIATVQYTAEAQELYKEYDLKLQKSILAQTNDAMKSHYSKNPRLVNSLALIFSLVERNTAKIDKKYLEMALKMSDFFMSHSERVYYSALDSNPTAEALIEAVKNKKIDSCFSVSEILQKKLKFLTVNENVQKAIDYLRSISYLKKTVVETQGRPSIKYWVNPNIF